MFGRFWLVASWADLVLLLFPFDQSCANTPVFRCVFGYPPAMVGGELLHNHRCGWPVYEGVRLFRCVPIAYPPLLCDRVADGVVEFSGRWVGEFGGTQPDLPLLPMDVVTDGCRGYSVKVAALEVVPVSLCQ